MRGQKKPLSPSLRRRGATWTWRCGTLWLTTVFVAVKLPSAPSTSTIARDTARTVVQSGTIRSSGITLRWST